jgi:hypothetical protein
VAFKERGQRVREGRRDVDDGSECEGSGKDGQGGAAEAKRKKRRGGTCRRSVRSGPVCVLSRHGGGRGERGAGAKPHDDRRQDHCERCSSDEEKLAVLARRPRGGSEGASNEKEQHQGCSGCDPCSLDGRSPARPLRRGPPPQSCPHPQYLNRPPLAATPHLPRTACARRVKARSSQDENFLISPRAIYPSPKDNEARRAGRRERCSLRGPRRTRRRAQVALPVGVARRRGRGYSLPLTACAHETCLDWE